VIALAIVGAVLGVTIPALVALRWLLAFRRETRVTIEGEALGRELADLRLRIQKLEMRSMTHR